MSSLTDQVAPGREKWVFPRGRFLAGEERNPSPLVGHLEYCPFAPHPREAAVSRICNHSLSVPSVDGSNLQILRLTSFVTRPVRFQSDTKIFRSESMKQPCAALNRPALMSCGSSS